MFTVAVAILTLWTFSHGIFRYGPPGWITRPIARSLSRRPQVLSRLAVLPLLATSAAALNAQPAAGRKTRNILFVMADGLRWQELFQGADGALMNKENGGVTELEPLKQA